MLKKRIMLMCMLAMACISQAQTLHALLFLNVEEPGREAHRKADMKAMHAFWGKIANSIGYDYSPTMCTPSTFSSSFADEAIDGLQVGKNDIVVFYYHGHGYNDMSDIWPSLAFNDRDYRLIDIFKKVKEESSPAKLTLVIGDCCNKPLDNAYNGSASYDAFEDDEALTKLFLGFHGKKSIIISASKQGQYGFFWLDGPVLGSVMGINFRKVISGLHMSQATWDAVLEEVSERTNRDMEGNQTPQFNITQSGDPFED